MISVSDNNILIFKEINSHYQLIVKIAENCKSLLEIKSKNILVTTNENCTKFRNLQKYKIIRNFKEIKCNIIQKGIGNIDNERIIILSNYFIKVISISRQEIIKTIKLYIQKPEIIQIMKRKWIFFIAVDKEIYAYDSKNYKYLISQSLAPFTDFYLDKIRKLNELNEEKYLILKEYDIYINKY